MRFGIGALVIAIGFVGQTWASPIPSAELPTNPNGKFLSQLHAANLMAVELGKLARSRGTEPRVKSYAKRLVRDYTRSDHFVTGLALREGFALADTKIFYPAQSEAFAALAQLRLQPSGELFDRTFLKAARSLQEKMIKTASSSVDKLSHGPTRNLAWQILPEWRYRLDICKQLEKVVLAE